MSVEFSNAYQEILLDNLMSVIKQNFIFQTQIKLTEDIGKQKSDLEKSYFDLNEKYNELKPIAEQIDVYKQKAEQHTTAHDEKNRIQIALNDLMKNNNGLKNELEDKNLKIKELEDYIKVLESNVAVSKLKKINPTKVIDVSLTPTIQDGSSF